jgi:pimeloyl-ACP methyl ester carboxylesterase
MANEMPEGVHAALVDGRAPLLTVVGLASMIPGATAGEAAQVKVPVFVGVGEQDIATDPLRIPAEFPASPDITLYVLPKAGHNHNVEPNRHDLWDRVVGWMSAIAPRPAGAGSGRGGAGDRGRGGRDLAGGQETAPE